jgi:hypothetical protein
MALLPFACGERKGGEASVGTATERQNSEPIKYDPAGKDQVAENENEGADPPRFSPEPSCHVFGSNLVANCAEYYGSAGSSGY